MAAPLLRCAVVALLLGSAPVVAQPRPPVPAPVVAQPRPPVPPPVVAPGHSKPAVHAAPVVRAKPGTAGRPVAHAAHPPHARVPAAPVVVPAPTPPPAPEAEQPAAPDKGSNTGQPLPRFATLRSEEVNLRTGPGTRYPIEWVYKRRDLPVQIQREFEVWRLVQDQEGVKGWVHQAVLAPRRTGVVIGEERVLRHDPRDDASPVARLKPGVIVRLRSCEAGSDWCQGGVGDYRGWIKRSDIWGTFPGEAIQ